MNSTEKGERYARIFRKVGVFLAKGQTSRALDALNEGLKVAEASDDSKMAALFQREIVTVSDLVKSQN